MDKSKSTRSWKKLVKLKLKALNDFWYINCVCLTDILEITVREFQRHRNLENPEINKYRAGYADCAREVARYLATPEPLPSATVPSLSDPGSKSRLLRHLDSCVLEIDTEITTSGSKDHSMTSRDYLRTPSTMNNTDTSQDSINPLDYSKINHDGALNLSKNVNSPPTNSQDENNNGRLYNGESTSASPTATLVADNFSSSSSLASTNKQPPATRKTSNKAITSSKRNKSFVDKSDESVTQSPPVPPKKAMIKSVEKERIAAVNRMEIVYLTLPHTLTHYMPSISPPSTHQLYPLSAFKILSVPSALARIFPFSRKRKEGND